MPRFQNNLEIGRDCYSLQVGTSFSASLAQYIWLLKQRKELRLLQKPLHFCISISLYIPVTCFHSVNHSAYDQKLLDKFNKLIALLLLSKNVIVLTEKFGKLRSGDLYNKRLNCGCVDL